MKTCFKLFIIISLVFSLSSQFAFTKVHQRMAIPKGTYSIPKNSSKRIKAFCMDYTRARPFSKTIYKFLQSKNVRTFIKIAEIGNKVSTILEAIDKGYIEITGKKSYIKDLFQMFKESADDDELLDEVKEQHLKFYNLWENASENERGDINSLFSLTNCIDAGLYDLPEEPEHYLYPILKAWRYIPDSLKTQFDITYNDDATAPVKDFIQKQLDALNTQRDFSTLQITNKKEYDIEIILEDDIILGETEEDSDCLLEIMGDIPLTDQQEIWRRQNDARLKILNSVDCVDESITDATEKLKEAVKCFQSKNNLKHTGIIDKETEKLLCEEYFKNKE